MLLLFQFLLLWAFKQNFALSQKNDGWKEVGQREWRKEDELKTLVGWGHKIIINPREDTNRIITLREQGEGPEQQQAHAML